MSIRVVFMGSPNFALPSLKKISEIFNVVGVVTQPDKPSGRGQSLASPPIKDLAIHLGLPVFQPVKLRNLESFEILSSWKPDLIVVAAYGQILRQNVLDLPKYGCINVHASLLPRWRGASPIQAAIANGDIETGVTIMKMDAGIDTGDVLSQIREPIQLEDTSVSLERRLAEIGGQLLVEVLPDYLEGRIKPFPQPEEGATYARMLKKEDGNMDFTLPVAILVRIVKAYQPWPGTFINWEGNILKILSAYSLPFEQHFDCGMRSVREKRPVVAARDGWLVLREVQPQGKKSMPGEVFMNGAKTWRQV